MENNKIAVIIPAYNEEKTITQVIEDFNKFLPHAYFYIVDNNSQDNTNQLAKSALKKLKITGEVVFEKRQGKAHAVRKAFQEVNADIYIMVDADSTYPANIADKLIRPVLDHEADMVVGDRLAGGEYKKKNKRAFHSLGNQFVKRLINLIFNADLKDIMSGYRVFNRRFIKFFPILSQGFEIETEMTLHALDKRFLIKEIPIEYLDRPQGSVSKLSTYKDGFKVVKTIFRIFKDYKPFAFFGFLSLICALLGILIGIPVILEFIETLYVKRVPSAILATGFMIFGMLLFSVGLILDTVVKIHKMDYELKLNQFEINK